MTKTANPTTLPPGGGDVEYTISVTCEPADQGCLVFPPTDDIHGPITAAECPEFATSSLLGSDETRSCTFTRTITEPGPATITNTTTFGVDTGEDGGEPRFETAQATVTVEAPPEEGGGGSGGGSACNPASVEASTAAISGCVDRLVQREFTRRGVPSPGGSSTFESPSIPDPSEPEEAAPDVEEIEGEVDRLLDEMIG